MELDRITEGAPVKDTTPRLSDESLLVLQLAVNEAATFGRGQFIDTGDLLIGLSQTGSIGDVLTELGVTTESVRKAKIDLDAYDYFNQVHPSSTEEITTWQQLPRTERLKKLGEMVTEKARLNKKELVEPVDILEVIVQERKGIGARVLRHLGVSRKNVVPPQIE